MLPGSSVFRNPTAAGFRFRELSFTGETAQDELSFIPTYSPIPEGQIDGGGTLHAGDWNGDGLHDVLYYHSGNGRNRWYVNNGDMSFEFYSSPIPEGSIDGGGRLHVGDWNGDGLQDIVYHNATNGRNRWYINNGDMTFTAYLSPIPKGLVDGGGVFYVGDWNVDGLQDVVYYQSSIGRNRWFVNNGDHDVHSDRESDRPRRARQWRESSIWATGM